MPIWLLCVLVYSSLGLSFQGLCVSWTWLTIFSPMFGKFSAIISTNIFSGPYLFFHLSYPAAIPSSVLGISVLSSCRSLVNISCIFSTAFPRSWIIFTIVILNSFFWKVPYLHFIRLFFWGFILFLHLGLGGGGLVAKCMSDFCNPMDCSLPGSSVHGILQARILEWVAMSSPEDLPDPGIKLRSPALQMTSWIAGGFFTDWATREAPHLALNFLNFTVINFL